MASSGSSLVQLQQRELKRLYKLSKSIVRDLEDLKKDPRISRRSETASQLEDALWSARETRDSLKEMSIRHSIWPKPRCSHKSTQTTKSLHDYPPVNKRQWENVGKVLHKLNQTVLYGAGKMSIPLVNESKSHRLHEWYCDQSMQHLVPTLTHWIDAWVSERQEVQQKEQEKEKEVEEESFKEEPQLTESEKMVNHFKKLFDVPNQDGVYTRMNDIYNRLGELMNVFHVIKDILGLKRDEPISRVISVIRRLCEFHSDSSTRLLRYLLQTDDLNKVVIKLEEYHKFFPVFDRVASDLMNILEVDSLSHVVPAVKALKLLQP